MPTPVNSGTLTWGAGSSPRTVSADIGTLTDGVLYVILNSTDTDDDITEVKFNEVVGEQLGTRMTGANGLNVELWCVKGVTGTATLSISFSSDGSYFPKGAWASFSGIDQTVPHNGTPQQGQGTGPSLATDSGTCPVDGLLIGFGQHMTNNSLTVQSPATAIVSNGSSGGSWTVIATRDTDGAITWTGTSSYARAWYLVAANPSGGASFSGSSLAGGKLANGGILLNGLKG